MTCTHYNFPVPEEKMVRVITDTDPVSYTHLDVYKRQALFYVRVYLKSRKYRLFLQTQPDFTLKSLGTHKGCLLYTSRGRPQQ